MNFITLAVSYAPIGPISQFHRKKLILTIKPLSLSG